MLSNVGVMLRGLGLKRLLKIRPIAKQHVGQLGYLGD